MASTFTDLGIEIMATGENAGTWGDKTNTNLTIVNTAVAGYVEQAVTNGGTLALTITDGAATATLQNAVIKLTGTITGNSIVTIPDSIEKTFIVTNGTSGAYTVQFKTVSGTGVTFGVSEKTTKLVYSDGTNIVDAGFSGGGDLEGTEFILDADGDTSLTADTDDQIDIKIAGADDFRFTANTFTALSGSTFVGDLTGNASGTAATVTTAAQSNITSLGTLTTLTVDDITINGSTISDSGDFTVDGGADIILDADGGDIFFKDGGTTFGSATNTSGNLIIKSGTTTALTFSGANVTVAGDLTVSGDDITMGTNTAGNILVADGTNFNSIAAGDLSAISTVAADDVLLAVDTSGGGLKKITRSALVSGLAAGELSNIVEDTSPQLGGNLDTNSQNILIDDAHFIADESGNEQIIFQTTGSAVNQFDITNAASGSGPKLEATGGDSNIDLDIEAKGTGHVTVRGNTNSGAIQFNCESNSHGQQVKAQPHSAAVTNVMLLPAGADSTLVSLVSTDTLTNKTLTTPILTTPLANAGIQLKNGATSAGFAEFFEDSDNGTNKVTLIGPAATADVTVTLPASTDTLVGKATTDTLTNKTLTAPKIADGGFIADANGNELVIFQTTGSAVNELEITNNASGSNPILAATGGDTNIGIALTPKGTGEIVIGAGNLNYAGTAVTSTGAELNILDGVTSTAAELNILDGVTSTAAEINLIDGGTSTGTTAVADADGIITNDGGTMRLTTAATFKTYFQEGISGITSKEGGTDFTNSLLVGTDSTGTLDAATGNTGVGTGVFGALTTGDNNTAIGFNALDANTTGPSNTAVGKDALLKNTEGDQNTAIGLSALCANTTGGNNVAVGLNALCKNTTATQNVAVGVYSGRDTTTGAGNTSLGYSSLRVNSEGACNVAIGNSALDANTTAIDNVAVGFAALKSNTTGTRNTAVGTSALCTNTTASDNTAVGRCSLRKTTTGCQNTAMGKDALICNTTGDTLVGVGFGALRCNTTADNNTAVGHGAFEENTTGTNGVSVGFDAGCANTTGAGNTNIGKVAGAVATTGQSNIMIGYLSCNSGANVNDEIMIGVNTVAKGAATTFINANGGPIYAGNNSANLSTTSDRRIKKNIVDNNTGLEKINQIRIRNFEYRTEDEITEVPSHAAILNKGIQLGVIAQEIEPILPDVVRVESTGVKTVDPGNLTFYIINAIKELKEEIDKLKNK